MTIRFFVTGTDTDVGKTYITAGLLRAFNKRGYSTLGIKPIASGSDEMNGDLYNQDAITLQQHSTRQLAYHHINPFVFKEPIAPHIAAHLQGVTLTVDTLNAALKNAWDEATDVQFIEGAGGLLVPLNQDQTLLDFVIYHQLPIIMVVGIKLGCLNHALLSYQAIRQANLPLKGWVANCLQPAVNYAEYIISMLKHKMQAPCLGVIPFAHLPEDYLNIDSLILS